MKRYLLGFFAVLAGLAGVRTMRAQSAAEHDLLWQVIRGADTMYLLGSMHMGNDLKLSGPVKDAIAWSDIIVGEMDLDDSTLITKSMSALMVGMYTDGTTLQDHVDKKTYQAIRKKLAKRGYDMSMLNMMKPWMIYLFLTATEAGDASGKSPAGGSMTGSINGIELQIAALVKSSKKEMIGFETAEDQLRAFDGLSQQTQMSMLNDMLKGTRKSSAKGIAKLSDAYNRGDTAALAKFLSSEFGDYPDVKEKLLTRRNKNWVQQIDGFLGKGKRYFIVVGAGHLFGSEGLLTLLTAKGYAVRKV